MKSLYQLEEVIELIEEGETMLLAGDEKLLSQLPHGNWIAGTIPYFMSEDGALSSDQYIQVTILPYIVKKTRVKFYSTNELHNIPKEYPKHGISFIILPAGTDVHKSYAKTVCNLDGVFISHLVGWVSGVHLNDLGVHVPKVFNGRICQHEEEKAVVMHVELPETITPKVEIVNLFVQDQVDDIEFLDDSFKVTDCLVNGSKKNFADYLLERGVDTRLPLVGEYCGATVNASFSNVDEENKIVSLYAPVMKDVKYRIAQPLEDYEQHLLSEINKHPSGAIFSCNCLLNYVYGELDGKNVGAMTGPITFGEIYYVLLNQAMVYVMFEDSSSDEGESPLY